MDNQFHIANTYLKVLARSNDVFLNLLLNTLGPNALTLLEDDYIDGAIINRIFLQFAEHGLDSWLLRYGTNLSIARSAYQLDFVQDEKRAKCILVDQTGGGLTGRWLTETGIRLAQQLIENVLAHPLGTNTTISFAYPEPSYKEELNSLLGVECNFDAELNSISFPASWCQISSPLSDQETHKTNLAKCHELKLAIGGYDHLSETVAMALQNHFESRSQGRTADTKLPTLKSLAIKNTHLTIADISYNLDYQEPANFVRAFKIWFDITPGSWRRQAQTLRQNENNNER